MRRVRMREAMMMAARAGAGKQALAEEGGQWRWMAMAGVWEMWRRGCQDEVQVWGGRIGRQSGKRAEQCFADMIETSLVVGDIRTRIQFE